MGARGRKPAVGITIDSTYNDAIKEKVRQHFVDHLDALLDDIESLEDPKDRVDRRLKLLDYFMPKVSAIKVEEKAATTDAESLLFDTSAYDDEEI